MSQITKKEEQRILKLIKRGNSLREITRRTGNSYGTIKRTITRNSERTFADEWIKKDKKNKKESIWTRIKKFLGI